MVKCQYIHINVKGVEDGMAHYPRLKNLREDRDLTQTEVAKLLFITQQQYSLYENGYREIPTTALVMLADFYGTSVDYILGRTDKQDVQK